VKKDEVGLYLHKAHPGSWTSLLSSDGIEHCQPTSWTSQLSFYWFTDLVSFL